MISTNTKKLNAEQKFILVATRINPTKSESCIAKELFKDVKNWDYITTFVQKHGVAGVLYYNSDKFFDFELPNNVNVVLKQYYYSTLIGYQRKKGNFVNIIAELNKIGIEPILLKGLAMVELLYLNPGLRPMSDIDFIVSKPEIRAVETCLLGQNLSRKIGNVKEEIRWYYDHHLIPFYNTETGLNIEPHWNFFGERFGFEFNRDLAIEKAEFYDFDNTRCRRLDYNTAFEFQVLTLKKGFFEGGFRLQKFNDLRLLEKKIPSEFYARIKKQNPSIIDAYEWISKGQEMDIFDDKINTVVGGIFTAKDVQPIRTFFLLLKETPWRFKVKTTTCLLFPSRRYLAQKFKKQSIKEIVQYFLNIPKSILKN